MQVWEQATSNWWQWQAVGFWTLTGAGGLQTMWVAQGFAEALAALCGYRRRSPIYNIYNFNTVISSRAAQLGGFGSGSVMKLELSGDITETGGPTSEIVFSDGCSQNFTFLLHGPLHQCCLSVLTVWHLAPPQSKKKDQAPFMTWWQKSHTDISILSWFLGTSYQIQPILKEKKIRLHFLNREVSENLLDRF